MKGQPETAEAGVDRTGDKEVGKLKCSWKEGVGGGLNHEV